MQETLVQPLQALFSCNLSVVDQRVFFGGFMRDNWKKSVSFSLQSFYSCNQHRHFKPLSRCVEPIIEKCRQSDIVAVKAIRLHMSYVDQLLSGDPDLRLIHLVRDPRGIVESWRKIDPIKSRSMTDMRLNAKLICERMLTDCRIRRQMSMCCWVISPFCNFCSFRCAIRR